VSSETLDTFNVEHGDSVEAENISIPKWLWVLIGCGAAFAFTHTCMQYVTAERVESLKVRHHEFEQRLDTLTKEHNRRAPGYESISGIRTDIADIRNLVLEVRDDVLVLKTRNGVTRVEPKQ
jgi:hypothetical protein